MFAGAAGISRAGKECMVLMSGFKIVPGNMVYVLAINSIDERLDKADKAGASAGTKHCPRGMNVRYSMDKAIHTHTPPL
jgi:hypothetical protein